MHHLSTGKLPTAFGLKPVRNLAPWISSGLEEIIMKSLEYNVEDRFLNAKAMKEALFKIKDSPKQKEPAVQNKKLQKDKDERPTKKKRPVSYKQMVEILGDRGRKPLEKDSVNRRRTRIAGFGTPSGLREKGKDDVFSFRKDKVDSFRLDQATLTHTKEKTIEMKPVFKEIKNVKPEVLKEKAPRTNVIVEKIVSEGVGGALDKVLGSKETNKKDKPVSHIAKLASREPVKGKNKGKRRRKKSH